MRDYYNCNSSSILTATKLTDSDASSVVSSWSSHVKPSVLLNSGESRTAQAGSGSPHSEELDPAKLIPDIKHITKIAAAIPSLKKNHCDNYTQL